ncbi:MAG: hypothetical protein E7582_05880 [Ruminococcaceae bacterium]|nr:hypothetical protein [Oscillospiraceae bacterium]
MKKSVCIIAILFILSFTVSATELNDSISEELNLNKAEEFIPNSISDITNTEFSVTGTPGENGLSLNSILKTAVLIFFDSIKNELPFVFVMLGTFVVSSLLLTFPKNSTSFSTVLNFVVAVAVGSLVIKHVEDAFLRAEQYSTELADFMTGLLPFFSSISAVGGEFSTSAVQSAILMATITLFQSLVVNVALPICRIVVALTLVGYVSDLAFSHLSTIISSTVIKVISIICGIMCAILYFQNSVTTVTDSLALRSVKLAAGNFIPIIGSFVSEASGTLISGVRLVKSTFGVFAICVLLYMTLRPLINFFIVKLSINFTSAIANLIGCNREGKVLSEILGVYNILSAVMIASACFFVFFITVFIKSEVS